MVKKSRCISMKWCLLAVIALCRLSGADLLDIEDKGIVKPLISTADEVLVTIQSLDGTKSVFHEWFPWKKPKQYARKSFRDDELSEDCQDVSSSIDEFPEDAFTQEQRLQGAVVLHFIGAIYFFTVSGIVINDYFIPAVECICDDLNITPDVGAAVFMATATASPEFFTNMISTFVADSDFGIGAVIGSLMWNILGVSAISSMVTPKPNLVDWVPITRDCIIFSINAALLAAFAWDGIVYWWEAAILLLFVVFYYFVMFQSHRISIFMKRKFEVEYGCCNRIKSNVDVEQDMEKPKLAMVMQEDGRRLSSLVEEKQRLSLWQFPRGETFWRTCYWYYSWPIKVVLSFTIPNPQTRRKLYPITFLVCIVWIGGVSYLLFWMLIMIAHTFGIQESVMGLTVFAIGGCTPEMITGIIMSRKGQAGTGVANSLGASSLAILLSLGMPWFIAAIIQIARGGEPFIPINNYNLEYTMIALLFVALTLYMVILLSRFVIRRSTGVILAGFYLVFISFAVVVELGFLFPGEYILC